MKNKIHAIASIVAMLCIASFFATTLFVELFGSYEQIATIKQLVVSPSLFILIPALAITGISGTLSAKNRKGRLISNKLKRMPFIAANGLLVLVPSAIYLNQWAFAGLYDTRFYTIQAIELLAGAINLALMIMNARDGLMMTGKLRKTSNRKN